MVNSISFFTPVRFEEPKSIRQYIQEGVDDYFYLGGKSAYVIPGKISGDSQEVMIKDQDQNKIKQVIVGAIKVISYIILAIPLIMLIAKAIFRATYKFHTLPKAEKVEKPATSTIAQKTVGVSPPVKTHDTTNNATETPSVLSLMERFTKAWNGDTKKFDFPENAFNLQNFTKLLSDHVKKFAKKGIDSKEHFGYIEKFDLNPSENPQIYMRADLHGDLKSLIENLRSLQEQGLLDDNFKCNPGVHLVFLGDYCDRGKYGTEILEMLMRLCAENPQQVHLIRGNHESTLMNAQSCFHTQDKNLIEVLRDKAGEGALHSFYETMSLTTYFSVDDNENREYVQCTHGLFEPTMDPAPLLDQAKAYLAVPKTRELSERIRTIASSKSELRAAAQRICRLVEYSSALESDLTAYNWADVGEGSDIETGQLGARRYRLNAMYIKDYLDLSSEQHRVMMIFRGHQHRFQHTMHEGKVLVTTLPVGMDCPAYQYLSQPDRAYIIQPTGNVENWKKRAILRGESRAVTDEVTAAFLLTHSAI